MSSDIKAGDLVYFKTLCCEPMKQKFLGVHFVAKKLRTPQVGFRCKICRAKIPDTIGVEMGGGKYGRLVPISMLRKVPPLGDLEGVQDERDVPVKHKEKV